MDKIKNITAEEAGKKLVQMINDIKVCMFFTNQKVSDEQGRPMSVTKADESGNIWFLANKNSHKIHEIQEDERVHLVFSHPGKEMYLDIHGEALITTNQDEIEELWSPPAKAWFPEGKNDPDICVIRVKANEGYYWDTQYGKMVELMGLIAAAITGKQTSNGVSGKLALN